jgi:NADH-quinone oxidoreductase subunit M
MNDVQLSGTGLLSTIVFSPLAGMFLVLLWPGRGDGRAIKRGAFVWSLIPLGLVLYLWWGRLFDHDAMMTASGATMPIIQQADRVAWLRTPIRADYFVGIDGINMPLLLLTVSVTPVVVLASFGMRRRVKTYFTLLMLLETSMLGYFSALNFFLFFLFWEFSLVPMFFMILLWGGPNRRAAAVKFFVYTMAGSIGMLVIFQFLYLATAAAGDGTSDLVRLARLGAGVEAIGGLDLQGIIFNYVERLGITNSLGGTTNRYAAIVFWAIFVAFAVKLGVWPFHTWLPDVYAEADTADTMFMAGVMSKMGAYGMLRLALPLLPEAARQAAPSIAVLGLASVVLGAYAALAQRDLKRLIAYTAINHMGLVTIGIAAASAAGSGSLDSRASAIAGVQMTLVASGFSTAALFYLAGTLIVRTGMSDIHQFGGLLQTMPRLAGAMDVALFANLGLLGLADFVGEFLIFRGAWATLPLIAATAVIGLIVLALALLRMFQHVFSGSLNQRWRAVADLSRFETVTVLPLLALLLIFGVYPALLLDVINGAGTALASVFVR